MLIFIPMMRRRERDIDDGQEREDESLDDSEEQLETKERYWEQDRSDSDQGCLANAVHHGKQHFPGENHTKETNGQRDDSGKFGQYFDREDKRRVRHVTQSPAKAVRCNPENLNHDEDQQRHSEVHVEVGGGRTHERDQLLIPTWHLLILADRPHARKQTGYVREQNEEEEPGDKGENSTTKRLARRALKQAAQELKCHLDDGLRPSRDGLGSPGDRDEDDEHQRHGDEHHEHRVRNGNWPYFPQGFRLKRYVKVQVHGLGVSPQSLNCT